MELSSPSSSVSSRKFFFSSILLIFSLLLSFASSSSLRHLEERRQQDKEDVFMPQFPSFHQSWQAQIVVSANLTNSNGKVEHSWYGTATERSSFETLEHGISLSTSDGTVDYCFGLGPESYSNGNANAKYVFNSTSCESFIFWAPESGSPTPFEWFICNVLGFGFQSYWCSTFFEENYSVPSPELKGTVSIDGQDCYHWQWSLDIDTWKDETHNLYVTTTNSTPVHYYWYMTDADIYGKTCLFSETLDFSSFESPLPSSSFSKPKNVNNCGGWTGDAGSLCDILESGCKL